MHRSFVLSPILMTALFGCAVPTGSAPPAADVGAAIGGDTLALDKAPPPKPPQDSSTTLPKRGNLEVTLSGVGGNDKNFEVGAGSLAGSVGFYLTNELELVARQTASIADTDPGPDVFNGSTQVGLDANIRLGPIIPYIGGLFGWVYGDSVRDSLMAGPEGGLKIYLKPNVFLVGTAEYQFFFNKGREIDNAFREGQFVYTLGFGIMF